MAKIYTIVLNTEVGVDCPKVAVIGSHRKIGAARAALADYIIDRLERDNVFWDSLFSDENHEEMGKDIWGRMVYISTDRTRKLLGGSRDLLRRHLMRELRCDGYYVFSTSDGIDRSYHFDIIKNSLEE